VDISYLPVTMIVVRITFLSYSINYISSLRLSWWTFLSVSQLWIL